MAWTWTAATLPPGLSLSGDGVLSGVLAAPYSGNIVVSATDGTRTVQQTITVDSGAITTTPIVVEILTGELATVPELAFYPLIVAPIASQLELAAAITVSGGQVAPTNRTIMLERIVEGLSLNDLNREFEFDRDVNPPAGTYSTALAPLLGAAGLNPAPFNTPIDLPWSLNFGSRSQQVSVLLDSGFICGGVEIRMNYKFGRSAGSGAAFIGGDEDQYRIRAEYYNGGNPVIWEITIFREGVIQVVFGSDFGPNDGLNEITAPTTPIPLAANTSFVLHFLKNNFAASYIVRPGSYTL